MSKNRRVIGMDLGNGMVKIRALDKKTGEPYISVLPSAWAYRKDVGDQVHSKQLDLDTFYIDDVPYVWGHDIDRVGGIKITYGHHNRYKTEAYKIMIKIALAKVVHDLDIPATEKIHLVTGVPSGETGTDCEEDIVKAFMGENKGVHEVDVNEDEHVFRIAEVEVMSQPVATVIGRFLDEEGYIGDNEYSELKVGVIDIGGGTTDLDIIDNLQRQKEFHSVPKGFTDVYNSIRATIQKRYPSHTVTDYELIGCLKEKKYKPSKRSEEVDFTTAMNAGVQEVTIDVQQAIVSKWKDQIDIDEILLIGASAKIFEEGLSNVVSGLTIPDNHHVSNVEGYFRWGMNRIGGDEK